MPAESIFINANSTSLSAARVLSSTNDQSVAFKNFVIADKKDFNIYIVDGNGAYIDISGYSQVRVGVGGINKTPSGGTFDLTGSGGTETIAVDASASTMQLALASAQAACSVTKPSPGIWLVLFDAVGAQALPTTDASSLEPESSVSVKTLVTGDGTTKAEWIIRAFQTPWAYSESWSNITNGVEGSLNFGSENLYKQMGEASSLSGYFEVELTDAGGNVVTCIQSPVIVVGEVIGDGVAGSADFASYITRNYETIICSVTDETESAAVGTDKLSFRAPYGITLTSVRASAAVAPSGQELIVDINESGSTILSTKLSIDAGEETSTTAATPAVISDAELADDNEISIDIDQVGSGTAGAGLKVYLIGYRT
tara:strand:+ start:1353 stop:2462 length:1110 start_codon:yes stop_codon:yes gene_type:complete